MTRFPLLLLGLFALALGSPARADITRGCRASIMVMGPEITANLQRLIEMDASGTCRRTQPNQCRLRAHQTLRACIGALWVGRGNHAIPAACQTGMGGSGRMNWTRWVGISPNLPHGPNSLVDRIRREACCPTRRAAPQATGYIPPHTPRAFASSCAPASSGSRWRTFAG